MEERTPTCDDCVDAKGCGIAEMISLLVSIKTLEVAYSLKGSAQIHDLIEKNSIDAVCELLPEGKCQTWVINTMLSANDAALETIEIENSQESGDQSSVGRLPSKGDTR